MILLAMLALHCIEVGIICVFLFPFWIALNPASCVCTLMGVDSNNHRTDGEFEEGNDEGNHGFHNCKIALNRESCANRACVSVQ